MAIIGISGKSQNGKNTVGTIVQYLSWCKLNSIIENKEHYTLFYNKQNYDKNVSSNWTQKAFASKLKQCVSIITGIPIEDLEKEEVKNRLLGEEWIRYGYADGFIKKYIGNGEMGEPIMNNKQCSKEEYEEHYKTNWQTAYKSHLTVRELLQVIGTDLFRNQLHEDTWVNALMSEYTPKICSGVVHCALAGKYNISCWKCPEYPNWIITDVRFPNELQAIKDKGGIVIRVTKGSLEQQFCDAINDKYNTHVTKDNLIKETFDELRTFEHPSETALDNATFDYIISAKQGDIESLIQQTKEILIKEKIIK